MRRPALAFLLALSLAPPALAADPSPTSPRRRPVNAGGAAPSPAPAAPAARPPRVAVLDFALAGSAHPDLARVLGDAAARGAATDATVQIMSQGEVVALLGLERTQQMLGCSDDQGCVIELAGALDADRLISGALTILDRTALLTVRLIDARRARTLARTGATLVDATEGELVETARRLAAEALTGKRVDTTGVIRLRVNVAGAEVSLDGRRLGESPIAEPQRVLEGPHAIIVQKPGYIRWSTSIAVAAGAEVPVSADLLPIQVVSERARSRLWAWGWTATGVFTVSALSGLYFGQGAQSNYDSYKLASTRSEASKLHDDVKRNALYANVSWGVAGAAAAAATVLFVSALREDARAAAAAGEAAQHASLVPVRGGAVLVAGARY